MLSRVMLEPPVIPPFDLLDLDPPDIPIPALELPEAELPSYEPIFVPGKSPEPGSPDQLVAPQPEAPQESGPPAQEQTEELSDAEKAAKAVQKYLRPDPGLNNLNGWPFVDEIEPSVPEESMEGVVTVNVLGLGVPVPEPEILVAAGATATTSVAATLATTSLIKKVSGYMKPVIKKIIAKLRKKKVQTWARERLVQRRHRQLHKDLKA